MPTDPRIDAYIATSPSFAQPVLKEFRAAVHAASGDIVETVKWRNPSFEYKGLMCGMAAFKRYTMIGFWKSKALAARLSAGDRKALEQIGRLHPEDKMPNRATLIRLVKAAMALNDAGIVEKRMAGTKKPPVKTPAILASALKKNAAALANYQAFAPSHKREYVEWVAEAKQDETRKRRVEQAVLWISEGKGRNWKYDRRT